MDFLSNDAPAVARELIGWQLFVREQNGSVTGGTIVETEAYTADDAASHSYNGKTKRNAVMFGSAGHAYVYFTYGMHWCFNIVTGATGDGQAVLIRGLFPTSNIDRMRQRRNYPAEAQLTNGPAKLCQALGITGGDNNQPINAGRIKLIAPVTKDHFEIESTRRIGIKKNTSVQWRFIARKT